MHHTRKHDQAPQTRGFTLHSPRLYDLFVNIMLLGKERALREMTVEMAFIPKTTPPIGSDPETITITFSDSAASQWAFTGFMTGFEPSVPLEERATASATIRITGGVTIT